MQHASIVSFLSGSRSAEEFSAEIEAEVAGCIQGCRSGGVGHIIVSDGPSVIVTREHAARLLRALIDQRLPFAAANYLADGLIMSDDFEPADTAVAEAIEFVADDSRPPTVEEAAQALARLV